MMPHQLRLSSASSFMRAFDRQIWKLHCVYSHREPILTLFTLKSLRQRHCMWQQSSDKRHKSNCCSSTVLTSIQLTRMATQPLSWRDKINFRSWQIDWLRRTLRWLIVSFTFSVEGNLIMRWVRVDVFESFVNSTMTWNLNFRAANTWSSPNKVALRLTIIWRSHVESFSWFRTKCLKSWWWTSTKKSTGERWRRVSSLIL